MQIEDTDVQPAQHLANPEASALDGAGDPLKPQSDSLELLALERADQPSMKRVMDVPLTVTLRFGQRQLTLRELLDLNTGSLVELDQQVEEPVHLMLGDRIIARGEVVIVDGNYGMRVLEVVERYPGQHGISGRAQ